jgi:transcriptional regulator with GAF, ATPase, and Fis domain
MAEASFRAAPRPFIGRETELARLALAYDEAARAGERLVIVRGDGGTGKTRLLAELKGRMRLRGAAVLEGRCVAGGRAYAPFADVLAAALAFLEQVGAPGPVELGPDLQALAGRCATGSESALDAAGPERRIRSFDAFRACLRAVAAVRPPIVLLHDVEHADSGTLDLLRHLLDGAGPFMEALRPDAAVPALFVVSIRTKRPTPTLLTELAGHPKAQVLELAGLGPEALRALFDSPAFVDRVMSLTGGRLGEIEELLASPLDAAEERMPRRLRARSVPVRALLSALAVVHRPASPALLERVSSARADGAILAELLDSGLVTRTLVDGETLLAFARSSERDLVYGSLDPREVRGLHRAYAAVLAAASPSGLDLQDVAFHALRGGDGPAAVRAACQAADVLSAGSAPDAAALLLEDALRLADESNAPEVHERLITAYRAAGDLGRALAHAKALLLWRSGDATVVRRIGELHSAAGQYDLAEIALETALGLAKAAADPLAEVEIEAELAEVAFQKGDAETALSLAKKVAGAELPAVALHARNTLGKVRLARGELAAAAALFAENVRLAQDIGLERELLRATINLAIVYLRQQQMQPAEELFERASRLADEKGSLHYQAICRENLAVLAHTRGDYGRALQLYHDAVALLKKLGNRPLLARAATNLGLLYLTFGDAERARGLAVLSSSMSEARAPVRAKNLVLKGEIELFEGRSDAARQALHEALEQARKSGDEALLGDAVLVLGRLELHEGDIAAARAALATAGRGESPLHAAQLAVLRADVERAAGLDPFPAAAHAVELAEKAGHLDVLWRAQVALARAFADRGDRRAWGRHLAKAREIDDRLRSSLPETMRPSYDCVAERLQLHRLSAITEIATVQHLAPVTRAGASPTELGALVGASRAMRGVFGFVEKVAPTDALVLIRGESGTGKELVADAIHALSTRKDRPLVKVNCAALVDTLLQSELFGHEPGAFTGAVGRKKGRFELADGGTLLLDEIGDVSPKTQVSLLRVLQERQFERVGGTTTVRVDVRILCATNRDLERMVELGTFRDDLYYRLIGLQVELPPLRERPEDIPVLAEHFARRVAAERGEAPKTIAPDALEWLANRPWPGNGRELESTIRTVALFVDGPTIGAAALREYVVQRRSPKAPCAGEDFSAGRALEAELAGPVLDGKVSLRSMMRNVERECIQRALLAAGGNITRAAALLGMKRPRLSQLVKQYRLAAATKGAEQ